MSPTDGTVSVVGGGTGSCRSYQKVRPGTAWAFGTKAGEAACSGPLLPACSGDRVVFMIRLRFNDLDARKPALGRLASPVASTSRAGRRARLIGPRAIDPVRCTSGSPA